MYHIPNDKRAMNSASALSDGLVEIMKKKTIVEITIKDITIASGVSRATFYRLFDNIVDILFWKIDFIMIQAIDNVKKIEDSNFKTVFYEFARYWDCHRDLIDGLIKSDRTDIFYEVHTKHLEEIKEYMLKNKELEGKKIEYLAELLATLIPICFRVSKKYPNVDVRCQYDDMVEGIGTLWKFLQ